MSKTVEPGPQLCNLLLPVATIITTGRPRCQSAETPILEGRGAAGGTSRRSGRVPRAARGFDPARRPSTPRPSRGLPTSSGDAASAELSGRRRRPGPPNWQSRRPQSIRTWAPLDWSQRPRGCPLVVVQVTGLQGRALLLGVRSWMERPPTVAGQVSPSPGPARSRARSTPPGWTRSASTGRSWRPRAAAAPGTSRGRPGP
jgi:hypothetical protein